MKRSPNLVDAHVGARVRSRRMEVGLTQDRLAKSLGITFQQIQKYEKGKNRIGAGRLQAIARILEKPISFFYANATGMLSTKLLDAQQVASAPQTPTPAEALEMIKTFARIEDQEARRHLVGLAEILAHRAKQEQKPAPKERARPAK